MRNTLDLWKNDIFFNNFFAPFQGNNQTRLNQGRRVFNPHCDIDETESHYLLSFDLPGISKDALKIEVFDNQLHVSGERNTANQNQQWTAELDETSNERFHERLHERLHERPSGTFKRSFILPNSVDTNEIEAQYKDGVLNIALPKSETAKPRQIKVKYEDKVA